MFRFDKPRICEPTFVNFSFSTVHIKIKLENYDKDLEADIYDYSLNSLENSKKMTDKILPFCANIEEINVLSDAIFQIVMKYNGINCIININSEIEFIQDEESDLCEPEYFNIDQFDEFLEMFSKTPFYKRPEFIKVAIKG